MFRCASPRRSATLQWICGLLCLAMLLTACDALRSSAQPARETPAPTITPTMLQTATPAATLPVPVAIHQSPALDALVQSGTLPPPSERLPEHPKVVPVVEKVGTYGGNWRMVIQPVADEAQFIRTVAYEPLLRWTPDWSGIEPNLAERYSSNANATEFTFTLRRGLRWSDGAPFTTADIRFWYQDVLLNEQLTPVVPSWLTVHGKVTVFEFVDDYTFIVRFSSPNSLFLQQLATPDALAITAFPFHYLRSFHTAYADPAGLERRVRAGGYASWMELFFKRVGVNPTDNASFVDPERPRLSAWVLASPYTRGAASITWKRNSYYWKVDAAGNQLPYIDTVTFQVIDNLDEAVNRFIAGDIDMQNLNALGVDVDSILSGGQETGFASYSLLNGSNNVMGINFNLSSADSARREMFRDKNFRVALSYAINRPEIIAMLFHGKGIPAQLAPRPESPFYDPQMSEVYTEYSPEKARQLLDGAGYRVDQIGNRLDSSGIPITFTVEVLENQPQQIAMLNMIARYWGDIGIHMQPKIEPLPIFLALVRSNSHDAAASSGGATMFSDVLLDPGNYLPSSESAYWAVSWANWFNRVPGFENEQPEESARIALNQYDRVRAVTNLNDQVGLMKGVLVLARENFWTIGIAQGSDLVGILRKNFHNVPAKMPAAWLYPDPAPTNPEQYFIAGEQ